MLFQGWHPVFYSVLCLLKPQTFASFPEKRNLSKWHTVIAVKASSELNRFASANTPCLETTLLSRVDSNLHAAQIASEALLKRLVSTTNFGVQYWTSTQYYYPTSSLRFRILSAFPKQANEHIPAFLERTAVPWRHPTPWRQMTCYSLVGTWEQQPFSFN